MSVGLLQVEVWGIFDVISRKISFLAIIIGYVQIIKSINWTQHLWRSDKLLP